MGTMPDLFGSYWRCESGEERTWRCPRCGEECRGPERKLRRFLTLFDRSLLSLEEVDGFVRCGACGRTYRSAVVDGAKQRSHAPLSEDERAIHTVVACVIYSDSSVRSVEKRAARDVIRRFTGQDLDSAGLKQVLRTERIRARDPVQHLRRLECLLDDAAKRRIVAAAYLVSGADREIHRAESRLLMQIAEALNLAPREVHAAMQEAAGI